MKMPEKLEREIESFATKRSKRQCSTANEHLDKAVEWYLKIGAEDGARHLWSLVAPVIEAASDWTAFEQESIRKYGPYDKDGELSVLINNMTKALKDLTGGCDE